MSANGYTGEVRPGGPADVRELPGITISKLAVSEMSNNVYLLRCRVRYFTDGVALGEKGWIESLFAQRREWFGAGRRTGARPLRGVEMPGLRTMRDLQVRVFG